MARKSRKEKQKKRRVRAAVVGHLWSCHSVLLRHRVCFLLTSHVYSISTGLPPSVYLWVNTPCHSSRLMRPNVCYPLTGQELPSSRRQWQSPRRLCSTPALRRAFLLFFIQGSGRMWCLTINCIPDTEAYHQKFQHNSQEKFLTPSQPGGLFLSGPVDNWRDADPSITISCLPLIRALCLCLFWHYWQGRLVEDEERDIMRGNALLPASRWETEKM